MKVSHLSNSCRNYFYKSKSLIDILTLLYVWSFSLEMYSYSHINKCTVLIPYLRSICIQDQLDDESLYMLYLYPGSAGWWIPIYVVFVSRISWMMNLYSLARSEFHSLPTSSSSLRNKNKFKKNEII